MDFVELTKRLARDVYDASARSDLQRLGRALERAGDLAALLDNDEPALAPFPASSLAVLAEVHREFSRWKAAHKEVRRALAQSRLTLPDESLKKAAAPDELRALERTARMCTRSGYADYQSWSDAVDAHLDLWRAGVKLAIAEGAVSVRVADGDHPDAEDCAAYACSRTALGDVRGYRWLGARRGERSGALIVDLELPWEAIEGQAEIRLGDMGPSSQKRGARSVVEELVSRDLEPEVRRLLDERARKEAVRTARAAYASLLESPPIGVEPIVAAHATSSAVGLAVLDGKGEILDSAEVRAEGDLGAAIGALVAERAPAAAVMAASGPDADRLREVEGLLGDLPVQRVHPAAIRAARSGLPWSPPVAGAVVLGRRALRPAREWAAVDPVDLGLGEFPREIDPEVLRAALVEEGGIAAWGRRRSGRAKPAAPKTSGATARRKLNPLVRTIRDLKPGMVVEGVVTNLTRFGAFVNIGLSTEAMIHISQLSNDFVDEPSQVVSVGQAISPRVLEVVPEKNRIALSLKPPPERGERQGAEPGQQPRPRPGGQGERRQGSGDKSRSAALADLDALFKK